MTCLSDAAWAFWLLGYPDQAGKRGQEALTLSETSAHPFTRVFALFFAALLHQCCREGPAAKEQAEEVLACANEQGFTQFAAMGQILRGWALADQGRGQEQEGITHLGQGLAAFRATGARIFMPSYLSLLAEAYGRAGQTEDGLSILAEALDIVDRTGEHFYEAELYRLKGELTLQSSVQSLASRVQTNQKAKGKRPKKLSVVSSPLSVPNTQPLTPSTQAQAEAEACFHKAIEIARRQSAKSLELRAVMSLSRLWQSQGKKEAAHKMLAEIYGWFTEGFDTADLQEAKALLEELSQ